MHVLSKLDEGAPPALGCGRYAVHCKEGGHMQMGGGSRSHSPHSLQQLPENTAQRPHVDCTGVAASRHDDLQPHLTSVISMMQREGEHECIYDAVSLQAQRRHEIRAAQLLRGWWRKAENLTRLHGTRLCICMLALGSCAQSPEGLRLSCQEYDACLAPCAALACMLTVWIRRSTACMQAKARPAAEDLQNQEQLHETLHMLLTSGAL